MTALKESPPPHESPWERWRREQQMAHTCTFDDHGPDSTCKQCRYLT